MHRRWFLVAHKLAAHIVNTINERCCFSSFLFFSFLHTYFQEVLLQDHPGLQGSHVTWPPKVCNEVSEPAIIPRGSQCSKIPSLPPRSTMKTWGQYFGKALLEGCQPLSWTLVRLDFHSIHVTVLLKKRKKKNNNVVGFSEVGALIAKTVEEEIKVVSQKPKWEIQFIEHYSALLRAVLYACLWLIAHLHFWWLHSKELLPKMNSWYSAFLFAVSVCSQINCTYISQGFERRNISRNSEHPLK